jgi:hypothetical protein
MSDEKDAMVADVETCRAVLTATASPSAVRAFEEAVNELAALKWEAVMLKRIEAATIAAKAEAADATTCVANVRAFVLESEARLKTRLTHLRAAMGKLGES